MTLERSVLSQIVRQVWLDNTEEEAMRCWADLCRNHARRAAEILEALDEAVAAPPEFLIPVLREDADILLVDRGTAEWHVFSDEQYLVWLRTALTTMKVIHNETDVDDSESW